MEKKPSKISIIGAGAVGASCAFSIATQKLVSELVIIDVNTVKAEGEAMDISHGLVTMGPMNIYSGSYEDIKDSDIILITAGRPQARRDQTRPCRKEHRHRERRHLQHHEAL